MYNKCTQIWPYKLYIFSRKYFTLFRMLMQIKHRYFAWLNWKPSNWWPQQPSFLHILHLIRNYLGATKKKMEIINFNEFLFSFGYIEELNRLDLFIYFIYFSIFCHNIESKHLDMTTRANDCPHQKIKRTDILAILGK